ncbi:MAG: helix-turn-helix transcriptional regulator [Eubacterium sp.]|jgi:DNA-binding HxlR family transcriptional regulator|nr:helix-turn-helix transcriptional regulator [Eubacterium sp.]
MAVMENKEIILKEEATCPFRYAFDIVGGKWKLPIVCLLASGNPARYSSIKRSLGDVTNMMLSQSLKELEAAGMIHREQYNEVPPRVEYMLTQKGISLLPVLFKFGAWGSENMQSSTKCFKCQEFWFHPDMDNLVSLQEPVENT